MSGVPTSFRLLLHTFREIDGYSLYHTEYASVLIYAPAVPVEKLQKYRSCCNVVRWFATWTLARTD